MRVSSGVAPCHHVPMKVLVVEDDPAVAEPLSDADYDIDNRLTLFNGATVAHDADGNMTSGPLLGSTAVTYTYDAANRLLSAGGVTYTYDVLGQRTAVTHLCTRHELDGRQILRLVVVAEADEAKAASPQGLDELVLGGVLAR